LMLLLLILVVVGNHRQRHANIARGCGEHGLVVIEVMQW